MMAISYGAQGADGREGLPEAVQVARADRRLVQGVRRLPEGASGPRAERARRLISRCARSMRSRRSGAGRATSRPTSSSRTAPTCSRCSTRSASSIAGRSPPATRDPAVWARHVTWAKVFMSGIAALHESKIVHADLKPANAYLIKDPTIGAGYQLKLIDMDFSLLADRRAPWHRLPGLCRHRQLPLARASDARGRAGACLGRLHLRADALRASRRLSSLLAGGPGRVCQARAEPMPPSRPRLPG